MDIFGILDPDPHENLCGPKVYGLNIFVLRFNAFKVFFDDF